MAFIDQLGSLNFDPQGILSQVLGQQQPSGFGIKPTMNPNSPMLNAMAPTQAPTAPEPSFMQNLATKTGALGDVFLAAGSKNPGDAFQNLETQKQNAQKMSLELLKASKPTMTPTGQPGIMLATFPDGSTKTVVVDEAVKSYMDQQDRLDKRQQNQIDAQDRRLMAQIDAADRRSNASLSNAMAIAQMKNDKKVLPSSLQKSEDTDFEAVQGHQGTIDSIAPIRQSLETGQLNLGAMRNAYNASRNFFGKSTPESQAYADLERNITRITNESLRLNKGVQTEGDAQRAAKEVLAAFAKNDNANMIKALNELEEINARAGTNKAKLIDTRRKSQGIEPMFGGQSPIFRPNAPAANGGGDMVINGVTVKKVN